VEDYLVSRCGKKHSERMSSSDCASPGVGLLGPLRAGDNRSGPSQATSSFNVAKRGIARRSSTRLSTGLRLQVANGVMGRTHVRGISLVALALVGALACAVRAQTIVFDFETDDNNVPLLNGQEVLTPPDFGRVVEVSSSGMNLGVVVFDSNPVGPNGFSPDFDLLVDTGNLLVLQDPAFSSQSSPGFFDVPGTSDDGGAMKFDFVRITATVRAVSIDVIDRDDTGPLFVTLADSVGRTRVFFIPIGFSGDVFQGDVGIATIELADGVPTESPNTPGLFTQVFTEPGFDVDETVSLEVQFRGSGAIDNLVLERTGCDFDVECSDGLFCTGVEQCVNGECQDGVAPCSGSEAPFCDEDNAECDECRDALDCDPSVCVTTETMNCTEGRCVCEEVPDLCLLPVGQVSVNLDGEACVVSDGIVEIDVRRGFSSTPVCGAQFFVSYDPSSLEVIEVVRGADLPDNPNGGAFNTVLFDFVDPVAGLISYALGDNPVGNCDNATSEPATIARIRFNALDDCESAALCFEEHNPPTRFGGNDASIIVPTACGDSTSGVAGTCTAPLSLNGSSPTTTCPFDGRLTVNADCGTNLATVVFDPITFEDSCDGPLVPTCTIDWFPPCGEDGDCGPGGTCGNATPGVCDQYLPFGNVCNDLQLVDSGGQFCEGVTAIRCSAGNSCEQTSACSFEIYNTGLNTLSVDLEVSPTMDSGNAFDPLTRCFEFELGACGAAAFCSNTGFPCVPNDASACDGQPSACISPGVTAVAEVVLGLPTNFPGRGQVTLDVPAGNWDCLTVRDPLHSLRSTCGLTCVDNVYSAEFLGSPNLGGECHWLVNGNLNGDSRIDILDFAELLSQSGSSLDEMGLARSVDCGMMESGGPGFVHGDFNGDGLVDVNDFSFIVAGFFDVDASSCAAVCNPQADSADADASLSEISVDQLVSRGMRRSVARKADLNADGRVDVEDMAILLNSASVAEFTRVRVSRTDKNSRPTRKGVRR
jgi:hypothetical protein